MGLCMLPQHSHLHCPHGAWDDRAWRVWARTCLCPTMHHAECHTPLPLCNCHRRRLCAAVAFGIGNAGGTDPQLRLLLWLWFSSS